VAGRSGRNRKPFEHFLEDTKENPKGVPFM